jgi:hypothetical protein
LELLDDIIHREDEIRLANPVETPNGPYARSGSA